MNNRKHQRPSKHQIPRSKSDESRVVGQFRIDEASRTLSKDEVTIELTPKAVAVLVALYESRGHVVTHEKLREAVWPEVRSVTPQNVREHVRMVRNAIGDSDRKLIRTEWGAGYCCSADIPLIVSRRQMITVPEEEKRSGALIGTGFNLVVDGMIINSVAEFLHDDPETRSIHRVCRASYERSLADFSFALVYASHIVTSKDFRPSVTTQDQPGKELAARLGEICKQGVYPAEISGGRLLHDEETRLAINADIRRLAHCINDGRFSHFFRDYMKREALKHLGEDSSLFKKDLDPDKYEFKVVRPYYQHRSLQNSLGSKATDTLVSFLPKEPINSKDRYALNALREFATRNALSLITIMWESNLFAKKNDSWRVPHVLRALVREQSFGVGKLDQQKYLRDMIVQHALATALKHIRASTKQNVVTVLMNQRDEYPFNEIRKILEEEHLVFLSDDPRAEKRAQRVLRMINSHALQDSHQDGIKLKKDRSTLRELMTISAPKYDAALYGVFPTLNPAASF